MRTRLFATAALSVLVATTACSDPVTAPPAPTPPAPRFAAGGVPGRSALDLIEADIDAGVLDRNNGNRYRQYAVSAPGRLPARYRSAAIGKDATLSMVRMARDWDQLSAPTQQEILDLQASGFGALKETVQTAHFVLHYTRQGGHAVPALDADGNGTPDFIDVAAESLERSWQVEVQQLGYPAPIGTPAQKLHVYYQNLSYYGYTAPENIVLTATSPVYSGTASAYIVIENDFYGFPPNDEDRTGLETVRSGALKVTQAHEFMHAVQFAINVYQSGWLMESHATWTEDAVYDDVNDWRWYVPSFLARPELPIFSRYAYGAAFFMNWLTETHGTDVVRQVWLAAQTASTPDALRTAAFGGTWEGMKQFAPDEYLLDISDYTERATSVVPDPHNWIRATHETYPVSVLVPASTNRTPSRAPWGLGANFIEFLPAAAGSLTLTFDGADGYAWRAWLVATPARGGPPQVTELVLNAGSAGSATLSGFGTRIDRVALVPTIADRAGSGVPFAYGATVAATVAGP
jgi:hypothetical protein